MEGPSYLRDHCSLGCSACKTGHSVDLVSASGDGCLACPASATCCDHIADIGILDDAIGHQIQLSEAF